MARYCPGLWAARACGRPMIAWTSYWLHSMVITRKRFFLAGMALAVAAASPIYAQSYAVDASGLPILNSLESARGVAYIDFNGGVFWSGETRRGYDLDGNPTSFNAAEQEDIYNAWFDVSTHFAMFDINVTTVAPNKSTTPTAHLLITPDLNGGQAYVGTFGYTSSRATGYNNSGHVRNRTTALTHELGHILGAFHQDAYNPYSEYRGADPVTNIAPIMGKDFAGKFSSWQQGFTGTNMTPQDDLAVISNKLITTYNNFPGGTYTGDGFRPDEHGNSLGSATALSLVSNGTSITSSATGIIERSGDTDMFSFSWAGGDLTMTAEAVKNRAASPVYASSLGMNLFLYDGQGSLLSQDLANSANDVLASVSMTSLMAGTYYFGVESAGAYDDLGAYTLSLNGVAAPVAPLRLTVDQQTGELRLENPSTNSEELTFEAISINSASGALDPSSWISIAGNYDGNGNGSIDNGNWTITSAALTQLAESANPGGADGSLAVGNDISLGNAWIGALLKDLTATYTDLNGDVMAMQVVYLGDDNILGDLNTDGLIDASDWLIFITNNQSDMSGLNVPQAYRLGDLDGDLDNDIVDYMMFRAAFEAQNTEPGAFEAMLASVPEPSSLVLLLGGACLLGRRRSA